jgi:hypothetical protein
MLKKLPAWLKIRNQTQGGHSRKNLPATAPLNPVSKPYIAVSEDKDIFLADGLKNRGSPAKVYKQPQNRNKKSVLQYKNRFFYFFVIKGVILRGVRD